MKRYGLPQQGYSDKHHGLTAEQVWPEETFREKHLLLLEARRSLLEEEENDFPEDRLVRSARDASDLFVVAACDACLCKLLKSSKRVQGD